MTATPPAGDGRWTGLLAAVRQLTFANALVIIMLVITAMPAYLLYRTLNDEILLDHFTSRYRETSSQQSNCTLREARPRGGPVFWGLSTGFAYHGSDRYVVSVLMPNLPDMEKQVAYCKVLAELVAFMHNSRTTSPLFPGSDQPIIERH